MIKKCVLLCDQCHRRGVTIMSESHVEYKKPARFDQMIRMNVRCEWVKRSSFQFGYELRDLTTDDLIATGYTVHVTLDRRTQKSCALPAHILERIIAFEQQER